MLVERAYVPGALLGERAAQEWPFTVPCVRELTERGLEFTAPVTFLVGENGSGKSTIVEAIAEAAGLDAQGGRAGRKYGNDRAKTPLGEVMRLDYTAAGARMQAGPRAKRKGFFLRAETAFGLLDFLSGMPGYWEDDVSVMSHGEGFLTVLDAMFRQPGLYLMDEPEAALSFSSCLQLVGLMHRLGGSGAQVICATHSPVLASVPGADIIEVGDHGAGRVAWGDLDLVASWRGFLERPGAFLRHFTGDGA
ncbi:ABC transporter, ATP-binding protein [Actinorhabdospora filicis]|uniref:ABC transporter, ATP-binding protein n=1 Tax=Actinorhabdospora filicis TaxID=1785913 RepID=A0A9W6SLU9_9ACTN|nr:AAA family ATPase [Actinorhabdospora filicis]GLZ78285.1 ABC transporter, ATP-binding protein [Actinorhabdospora filicis]